MAAVSTTPAQLFSAHSPSRLSLLLEPDGRIAEIFAFPAAVDASLVGRRIEQLFLEQDQGAITRCLTNPGMFVTVHLLLPNRSPLPLSVVSQRAMTSHRWLLVEQPPPDQSAHDLQLSFILHSLKNSLALAQASLRDVPPSEEKETIEQALESAHMAYTQMRLLSRSASPAPSLDLPFSLERLLQTLYEGVKRQAMEEKSPLQFTPLNIPPQLPLFLVGNQQAWREIITNLLVNATRHTRKEGATLTLECKAALIGQQWLITIAVIDTGIGIQKEDEEKLFEPRFRGAASATTPGDGLGLAHARELALSLPRGSLIFSHTPGGGATFTLTALFKQLTDHPQSIHRRQSAPPTASLPLPPPKYTIPQRHLPRSEIRLLFVDDDGTYLLTILRMFRMKGLQHITVCSTFEEARERLQSQEAYDLFITDEQLGVEESKRGHLLAAERRNIETAKGMRRIPIIALSGDPVPNHDGAISDTYSKPIPLELVEAILSKWFFNGTIEEAGAAETPSIPEEKNP